MGEHKTPAAPIVMERPGMSIIRLKQACMASQLQPMDDDTRAFMADLTAAMHWIDHLEKPAADAAPTEH